MVFDRVFGCYGSKMVAAKSPEFCDGACFEPLISRACASDDIPQKAPQISLLHFQYSTSPKYMNCKRQLKDFAGIISRSLGQIARQRQILPYNA
jgi:hypothetical protein